MRWFSRGVGFANGMLFAYWCGIGSANSDWGLYGKFFTCTTLAYIAGYFWNRKHQPVAQLESERR